jgi:hypothetical protein
MEPCIEGNMSNESFKAVEPSIRGQLPQNQKLLASKSALIGCGK